MTKLHEILDVVGLEHHVDVGNVAMVRHPSEPLRLYNYTQRCQFSGQWDRESRTARGLIVDDDDNVIARPFPKFHNLHEHGPDSAAGPITLAPPLRVFDKVDGSLGIAYRRPSDGAVAWATRGSFTSDQAMWATEWWGRNHADVKPPKGVTWLAEIIYPENRIVLDYGDRQGLILLAALANESGKHLGPTRHDESGTWPADVVAMFDNVPDIAALDRNDRNDAEGYVVLSGDGLTRVKLKSDEYMRLHRIITGVSNVTVWELLRAGDDISTLYDKVPDEFATWAKATVSDLERAFAESHADARGVYDTISHLLPDRKAFAAEACKHDCRSVLFALADGKPTEDLIWKRLKPERSLPYFTEGDNA